MSALAFSPPPRRRFDAFVSVFTDGLWRTVAPTVAVATLLGVTLFQFVLPLLPAIGSRPDRLARVFLFAVQHLGDVLVGVLVVGQAGLPRAVELWRARQTAPEPRSAAASLWGIAALYFTTLMLFKVTAVVVAAVTNYGIDGRFLGGELGEVIEENGAAILGGYALNALVALGIGALCSSPGRAARLGTAPPVGPIFRHALEIVFAAKLVFFLV